MQTITNKNAVYSKIKTQQDTRIRISANPAYNRGVVNSPNISGWVLRMRSHIQLLFSADIQRVDVTNELLIKASLIRVRGLLELLKADFKQKATFGSAVELALYGSEVFAAFIGRGTKDRYSIFKGSFNSGQVHDRLKSILTIEKCLDGYILLRIGYGIPSTSEQSGHQWIEIRIGSTLKLIETQLHELDKGVILNTRQRSKLRDEYSSLKNAVTGELSNKSLENFESRIKTNIRPRTVDK